MASGAEPPRLVGGRYRVEEFVAAGPYMDEWSGHDERLDRAVTIRVIRQAIAGDEALRTRISEHLRQAVHVEDPGLTRIYDSLGPDVVGLVSEPITSGDLRTQISTSGPMSADRARLLTIELAKTLDGAHRAGVVHGGLSASSIGFTGDGRLVIRDLGTCASPDASPAAVIEDVTALASVLHELTCGRPPHDRGRGHELDPAVPASVAGLLSDAFGQEPPWPTAQHFAAALSNEPLEPEAQRGFATAERRWLVPVAGVLVVAALMAGIGSLVGRTSVGRDIIDNAREVVGLDPTPTTPAPTSTSTTETTTTPTTDPPSIIAELELARITDFDPGGDDGTEHPERLVLINDDDATRGWQTQIYTTRDFGRLKEGVGLIVELSNITPVTEIVVRSPTRGWGFEIFVSGSPPVAAIWGEPIFTTQDFDSDITVSVPEVPARSILLWITDLGNGPQFRVTITDIEVSGIIPE